MAERVGFWSRPLGVAIKCYLLIYGLTVGWNYVVNQWMRVSPIGPDKIYWFDNICWMLFSLFWCFLFAAVGNWPFVLIRGRIVRGVVAVAACWLLGYLTYAGVYAFGATIDAVFPIIGTLYAVLVFFCYTGENWLWADLNQPRQFFLIAVTVAALTWLIVNTSVRWIPPWWFPMTQFLLGTQLFSYLFRRLKQPGKTVAAWGLMWVLVWVWLYVSKVLGIWDAKGAGPSPFWEIGSYSETWLLFFFVLCSFVWGVLVPAQNWPFRLVRMPWGGILACLFCTALSVSITVLLARMVGPVFADIHEAQTYGYMGVAWAFMITLFFPLGHEKPYLWAGQEVPGSWEQYE